MNSYKTTEREEYISKLERQIHSIDKILKMNSGTLIDAELKKKLDNSKNEAGILLKKLKNNEFEIAVVGLEKAGKSTFVNALIENSLLPTAGPRCTFTSTQIQYSGDNNSDSAVVSFYSKEEFKRDFKEKLAKIGFPDYSRYDYDLIDIETYKKIYNSDQVSEAAKNAYGDSINEDIRSIITYSKEIGKLLGEKDKIFSNDEIYSDELNSYITQESKARAVRQVIIHSNQLEKMPNAVIFDVPGFNSPTELHKIQTRERMKSADAIVVIADGEHPSITGESLKILRESDDDGNPLNDKLFVFANRIELASDIKENMDTTYKEWISKGFVDASNKNRIIFGSALAHLISIEKEKNADVISAFERRKDSLPHGDGIDFIREKLEEYNKNERFEVLKRRINRINSDIVKAFGDIRNDYSVDSSKKRYGAEHIALVAALIHDVRPEAESRLQELRGNIRSYMPSDKPLSKHIKEYISENITTEKYSISDELIKKQKEKILFFNEVEDVARIEGGIREIKFKEMYDDFCKNIINIADNHHKEYAEQILDSILEAMKIDKSSPYCDELKEQLKKELSSFRNEFISESDSEIYYQSLIERYSRDIYEILIISQYNAERLRKFYASIDNYFSMSIFYRTADCKNELEYINRTPQEQPLCMMLLFHHYLNFSDNLRLLSADISRITGLKEISEDMLKEIEKAYFAFGGQKDGIINKFNGVAQKLIDKTDDFKINIINNTLNSIYESNEPCSPANREDFTKYYERYHNTLRGGKLVTLDDFREDFDKDIEILHDVLENAFVRAVDMEKPFVAREVKSIDEIIDYINSKDFSEFIADNFWKIKYQEAEKLDKIQREHEQNALIMGEINNILNEIEN